MVDVHFHGLPKKMDTCELERKLHDRFDVSSRGGRPGLFWGYSYVTSGVRIVKVQKEDASRIPAFFYVMGFRVRSWYKDGEQDRKCPKCNVVGHWPWACKGQPVNQKHNETRSYADAVAQNTNPKISGGQAQQQEQKRWRDILRPCKTPRRVITTNFINDNPFEALNVKELEKELIKEIEKTAPQGTSIPKSNKKRKAINLSSSVEERRYPNKENGKGRGNLTFC
ncbi:hypothetical protein ACJMK2_025080 [Sinanodonta woodiana]|uniref:Uncharacterized protein n=2 Tax=Sinanodonta woodiana TaxID=1069815 RepID=A0ABD3XHC9_SINWO